MCNNSDDIESLLALSLERCESHHSPRNFVDSSTGRSVSLILIVGGLWALYRGAVKCTTLHLWAANLNPFLVAHSCMAFTACCRCLSMVSRERPRKLIARSSTKSALKMSMAIIDGSSLIVSPKHVTARTPPVGTLLLGRIHKRVCSRFGLEFCGLWDTQTRQPAVCLWAQSYVGPGWYHIAKWSCRPLELDILYICDSLRRYHGFVYSITNATAVCMRKRCSVGEPYILHIAISYGINYPTKTRLYI